MYILSYMMPFLQINKYVVRRCVFSKASEMIEKTSQSASTVNLTQSGKMKPQMKNSLHQTGQWACLCSVFWWLTDVGGPSLLRAVPSNLEAGGPGLDKKELNVSLWASQYSVLLHGPCSSSCPGFPRWQACNLLAKWTISSPNCFCSITASETKLGQVKGRKMFKSRHV